MFKPSFLRHMRVLLLACYGVVMLSCGLIPAMAYAAPAEDARAVIVVEGSTYPQPHQALHEAATLRTKGWLGARVIMLRDGNARPWYVVVVDTPATGKEARAIAAAVRRAGFGTDINRRPASLVATRTVADPAAPQLADTTPQIAAAATPPLGAATVPLTPQGTMSTLPSTRQQESSPAPAAAAVASDVASAPAAAAVVSGTATVSASPAATSAVTATPAAPVISAPPDGEEEADPFAITERDRVIMLARSIQRQGDLRGSMRYWREALSRWPDDADVLDSYLEVLIDLEDTANAEQLLRPWLARTPDNLQALRQAGRLEIARGTPAASLPYFERLVALAPGNADHAADHANALLEAGERVRAIEALSRAHDLRPTAEPAPADTLAELLAAYRPHLKQEFTWLSQQQASTTISWAWALDAPVTDTLRMTLLYDLLESHSAATETTDTFSREIHEKRLRLEYTPVQDVTWRAGVGQSVDNDTQTETSQEAGVIWNIHRGGALSLLGQRGRPWYNTVDAARLGGNYDDIIVDYAATLADVWRVDVNGGLRRYTLGSTTYGTEHELIATLGRQLFAAPEVVLSYQFQRSRFFYQSPDDDPLPVVMLEREDVHGLLLDINDWITPSLGWFASASVQQDVFRHSPSTSIGGGLRLRVGHRLELEAGYTYQSDTGTADGGYAHTIKTLLQYTF